MTKEPKKNNLFIWEQVDKTPPSHTRSGQVGGRIVTTINPTYLTKQATDIFGPIGIDWGYDIVEERLDNGRPIYLDGDIQGHEMNHTIRLKLWYHLDGKRGEFEHFGHTPYIYWSHKNKQFLQDDEAPKKSLTDAIKKCLSLLGFSADIFMGMYEDPHYLNEVQQMESFKKEEEAEETLAEERKKFAEWAEAELEKYASITSKASLKAMHSNNRKKVERLCVASKYPFSKVWERFENAYQAAIKKGFGEVVCEQCGDVTKDKAGNRCRECGGKKIEIVQEEQ